MRSTISSNALSPSDHSPLTASNQINWLSRLTGRLSVGTKIACGYALALGIAVLGSTGGLLISDHYEREAEAAAVRGHEVGEVLRKLQVALLQARSHQQQFPALLPAPADYSNERQHFLGHIATVNQVLEEITQSDELADVPELQELVREHKGTVETYFQQIEAIIRQIDSPRSDPESMAAAQRSLLNFSASPVALRFDEFSDGLSEIAEAAFTSEMAADDNLEKAQKLGVKIVGASILLSVLIASLLAYYTNRMITSPIQAVTRVAKQVRDESNFNLQAAVTTEDEIGILATSFNQLIQRVKQLLDEQQVAAERERQMRAAELLQTEKMSSLGQMLAGVAHEINNPVNFIYGNLSHASAYIDDLLALLQTYQTDVPNPPPSVKNQIDEIDLDFVAEDLPKAIQSMQLGADRVRQIVLSLKNFTRLDDTEPYPVDMHECIDSTLLILNNRLKKDITVIRNYGNIPAIAGFAGLLYQVLMNLLTNAIDALEASFAHQPASLSASPDSNQVPTTRNGNPASVPTITITTERTDQEWLTIRIQDNGGGIPADIQPQIFDMFFTTKPRGVGTGMGLAISHQIIAEKHHGKLICTSEVGVGTIFTIALPIKYHATSSTLAVAQLS